ncbi:MAG TPA: hypothetical protein PLA73_07805 [Sedimentibacter sp.]|jgi:hypothetical protein|nr:hypothetical protein [Sedimentibacter sp.]HAS91347.1 hypothetical protein [Clostridiales bacterium]HOA18874.1 hypothetical protein [Sedimentibacter sp.]HOG62698.1 hypothetical protein [Sedimentibacter sp.]HOT21869.1 hypothetical protein [Sedimentibacter sp.]
MYKIFGKITDPNIENIISSKLNFDNLNVDQVYDIYVDFYNTDLEEGMLNADISYEIKKEHYLFIKKIRALFENNQIRVNEFYLMGTISDLPENEINISIMKSQGDKKKNVVWPCKEIFLYENQKNKLDALLISNQISEEDYESNLEFLKDELNIYENDEEHKYIN